MRMAVVWCTRCSLDWNNHLESTAGSIGCSLGVPASKDQPLLGGWWVETLKWAIDRPAWKAGVAAQDVTLVEDALHTLAGGEIPLDGGSSAKLHHQLKVTVELAVRGLRLAGRVLMRPRVWGDSVDPQFGRAGGV